VGHQVLAAGDAVPLAQNDLAAATALLDLRPLAGDQMLLKTDCAQLASAPALAMRAFAACLRHDAPLLPFARDAIAAVADDPGWCERLREDREAGTLFVDLVCTVAEARTGRGSVVGELHDVGLLSAMVPEFLPVIGRVHHDTYHVYTVDVHSVAAVDRLRQLARGELAQTFPLASRLTVEIVRPAPLFLATLLHDIGKGWPDASGSRADHSKMGAELSERILPRLWLPAQDAEEVRGLILDHLLMYQVATRRDFDDEATVEEFCCHVRGHEGLRNLYLLTIADVSTTAPTALTAWKGRMLEELYFAAEAHLARQTPRADADRIAAVRHAVHDRWTGPVDALDSLLAALPFRQSGIASPYGHRSIRQRSRRTSLHAGRYPASAWARHRDLEDQNGGSTRGRRLLCARTRWIKARPRCPAARDSGRARARRQRPVRRAVSGTPNTAACKKPRRAKRRG